MDCSHLADLGVRRDDAKFGVAIAIAGDASGVSERHVCLHLAFFRQPGFAGLAGNATGRHDGSGQRYPLRCGLVDLAIVQVEQPYNTSGAVGAV